MRRGEHGGDWAAYQIQYHGMPLDFSANVSPMGIPAGVKRALYQAVEEVNRYPDPLCRQLRACLGRHHDVSFRPDSLWEWGLRLDRPPGAGASP